MNKRACFVAVLMLTALAAFASVATAFPESTHPAMKDPSKATEQAPETFKAKFDTTKGSVVFECTRSWAPHGVDRFYNLVKIGFFHDVALFRVKKGFVVQWGIHGNPDVAAVWRKANLPVDEVSQSNTRGMLTYAMAGSPTTRSTQLFINYGNNARLDRMGFAPLCKVVEGMEQVVDAFYGEYGERPSQKQGLIQSQGNEYLRKDWPELDYIKTTSIIGEAPASPGEEGEAPAAQSSDDDGSNTVLYVLLGAVVLAAGFFIMRKSDDESDAPPNEKASNKKASKKKASKKKASKKKASKKKTSKKKASKTKTSKKKTARSKAPRS